MDMFPQGGKREGDAIRQQIMTKMQGYTITIKTPECLFTILY